MRFFTGVSHAMIIQMCLLTKFIATNITLKRFLTSMNSCVTINITTLRKSLPAKLASIRFRTGVSKMVSCQITTLSKLLITNGALIWSFTSVDTTMTSKMTNLMKILGAQITTKLRVEVNKHMLIQLSIGKKWLLTNHTSVISWPIVFLHMIFKRLFVLENVAANQTFQ